MTDPLILIALANIVKNLKGRNEPDPEPEERTEEIEDHQPTTYRPKKLPMSEPIPEWFPFNFGDPIPWGDHPRSDIEGPWLAVVHNDNTNCMETWLANDYRCRRLQVIEPIKPDNLYWEFNRAFKQAYYIREMLDDKVRIDPTKYTILKDESAPASADNMILPDLTPNPQDPWLAWSDNDYGTYPDNEFPYMQSVLDQANSELTVYLIYHDECCELATFYLTSWCKTIQDLQAIGIQYMRDVFKSSGRRIGVDYTKYFLDSDLG